MSAAKEAPHWEGGTGEPKVVVVMPAFNAARTLRQTYEELPRDRMSRVIVVDDASTDNTVAVARQLGLPLVTWDIQVSQRASPVVQVLQP